ncbi:uncharacterized protein [Lepeophtheirus salmonis]|uniref:Uncharacterized protein n=2 Tax=Lepeophtheirus salmonis TaxID=72036 RepID=A0A0K2TB16_LEPSM|nr:uncharacterized protein LOC121128897 [Lepeophtheirus salmonis]
MYSESKLMSWIVANGGESVWSYDNQNYVLTCRLCQYSKSVDHMYPLLRHVKRKYHERNLEIFKKRQSSNVIVNEDSNEVDFTSDLVKMFVSCNIPVTTVENPNFVKFVEKYTGKSVPSRFSMTKSLETESKVVLSKVERELDGKDIFMAMDENKDSKDRAVAVLIGTLDGQHLGKRYLINLDHVDVGSKNSLAIEEVAINSINDTLGSNFKKNRFKLFITDEVPYCMEAAEKLRTTFPSMRNITSSSKSDRVFSFLTDINSPKRNKLSSSHVKDILIMKCNHELIQI